MAKPTTKPENPYKMIAKSAFVGMLGFMAAMTLVGAMSFVFFMLGWTIVLEFNKEGTNTLEDLQPMQYFGLFICAIACMPFIQFFFQGVLTSGF